MTGPAHWRAHLSGLLASYEAVDGVGADQHDATPRHHAMAESRYLGAVTALRRSGLLGADQVGAAVARSVHRLEHSRVRAAEGESAWGLGFAYGTTPADEAYTITTAQVCHALLEAQEVIVGALRGRVDALAGEAVRWLTGSCPTVALDGADVPLYSRANPRPVHNATAYWVNALAVATAAGYPVPVDTAATARLLLGRAVPEVGWTYDDGSTRADLLHTCYILLGLMAALPVEDAAAVDALGLASISQFLSPVGLRDHFDVVPLQAAMAEPRPWNRRLVRVAGGNALSGFDTSARAWSVGELLVLAARASRRPHVGPVWRAQLRWLSGVAVGDHPADGPFRHTMHLAFGLASALEALRAPE